MQQIIDIAHRNSERLSGLVSDILDFEKIDAGQMSYNMRESNIDQLIAACVTSLQPYASEFGVTVSIVGQANDPVFIGDPDRISQVMTNLISNGIKFSKSGQQVNVKSENTSDCLTFPSQTLEREYRKNCTSGYSPTSSVRTVPTTDNVVVPVWD